MNKLALTLILSMFCIVGFAGEETADQYSEQLLDNAEETIEVVRQDRKDLKENYREIAKEQDDEWFQEVESIINEDDDL